MNDDEKTLKGFAEFIIKVGANGGKFQFLNQDHSCIEWCDFGFSEYEDCMTYYEYTQGNLRIKPEVKKIPLTRRDITPATLFREKEDTETEFVIDHIATKSIRVSCFQLIYDSDMFMDDWERSNDNSLTWLPCWKEVVDHVCTYPKDLDQKLPRLCVSCSKAGDPRLTSKELNILTNRGGDIF